MLASQLRGLARIGTRNSRSFGAQAATKYNVVKFQQEDINTVLAEVPDIPFYIIGNPEAEAYPYTETPVSEPIASGARAVAPAKGEYKVSQLENGLKVVSIDKSGVTSKIALYVNAGARHESAENAGVAHMTELMAYRSTAHLSYLRQLKVSEAVAGELKVDAGREHIAYTAEANREYLPHLVTLVTGNVLFPRLLRWEVDAVKSKVDVTLDKLAKTPAFAVQELLHSAAFYNNTLGNSLYSEKNNVNFNNETIKAFINQRYDPKNMTIVGVNVDHNEFAKWVARSFVDYTPVSSADVTAAAKYTGGLLVKSQDGAKTTQIAVAYKQGGLNTKDAVIASIVKAALGGASINHTYGSANTRLATNFSKFVDAEAISHVYSDAGIWGLRVEAAPKDTKAALEAIATQIKSLASLSEADINRAKAVVKTQIAIQTESVEGSLDFAAQQLLTGDNFTAPADAIAAVNKITAADVAAFVKNLSEPSVAILGQTRYAPHADEVKAILKK